MGFFAEFDAWLGALLTGYVADTVFLVANALEPAIVTAGTIYIVVWGYMHMVGRIAEPFLEGLRRIILLVAVLGVGLQLWLYNAVIIDTFFYAPAQLAAHVVGAYDAVTIIDTIIFKGSEVAQRLLARFTITSMNFSMLICAVAVYAMIAIIAVYSIFLLSLARVALSVLLALGPLFIGLLLFESTRHLFKSWLGQLASYAFVSLLSVMFASLIMYLITKAADQALSAGDAINFAQGLRVCMGAGLGFLVMRQVLPIAAALGGGAAMSTFGVISSGVRGVADASRSSAKSALLFVNAARGQSWESSQVPTSYRAGVHARSMYRRFRRAGSGSAEAVQA